MAGEFKSYTKFQCPRCSKRVTSALSFPELTEEHEGYYDTPAIESRHEVKVICPSCTTQFMAHADFHGMDLRKLSLDGYSGTLLSVEKVDLVDQDDYVDPDYWRDIPQEPYEVYEQTYKDLLELLSERGSDQGDDLVNRMIFAHQVTAMEAFLSDTMRKALQWHKKGLSNLLTVDPFKDIKASLAEVLADPDFVAKRVDKWLSDLTFHNFVRAEPMYRTAFNINLLPPASSPDRAKLVQAIELRHDCVHRNGFTKDGKRLNVLTKDYIQEISALMLTEVQRVRSEIIRQEYLDDTG